MTNEELIKYHSYVMLYQIKKLTEKYSEVIDPSTYDAIKATFIALNPVHDDDAMFAFAKLRHPKTNIVKDGTTV